MIPRSRGPRVRGLLLFALSVFLIVSPFAVRPARAQGQPPEGKALYDRYCAGCHGQEGRGDGPAADLLSPRPRDFTTGVFKIRTTTSGEVPTDEDLFRTITRGMPGSAMPGWEKLSEAERWELVRYIKSFSELFEEELPPERASLGSPIPFSEQAVSKGGEIYRKMKCWECHGEEGRGDGPSAPTLKDDWEVPIRPGNLTRRRSYRGGSGVEDIYRAFTTGLDGTPMPSFEDSLSEEERWQLAYYVSSRSVDRPLSEGRTLIRARALPGPLPRSPQDPHWESAEAVELRLAGQVVQRPRLHTPSVTSLTVRALYNSQQIAFLLQWDDGTRSLVTGQDGSFNDAVAIQFPSGRSEATGKPYFLLGDPRWPVILWHWEAGRASVKEYSAHGLGTQKPLPSRRKGLWGSSAYRNGRWSVVMGRRLSPTGKAPDARFSKGKAIPIGFYVWDGSASERWEKGSLSTWHWLLLVGGADQRAPEEGPRLVHPELPAEYVALENPLPDTPEIVRQGNTLYFKNCVFCHGDALDGRGLFADALEPRPADLTHPERLAQLHESYAFWRIREGGRGLPPPSRPWDSAMPRWKDDLSDDEIWKIIRFLYDAIGVAPRSWIE
ncbi:MAG: c-type cytochrome [Candidatus Methylomirabilales bacterium]